MNVLSLFDGLSCGQIALNRLGIKYDNYFASEIDENAIKVTQSNFPNTIQLGDVTKINGKNLPKIDLIIGGSPCQGFSFAGKQLNFNDPRSKLFFEYVRILKECNPKYFLLENVKMKKIYERVITENLEVGPVEINSGLVSAQDRKRLYWTNLIFPTFNDKRIYLKDILEENVDESFYIAEKYLNRYKSVPCVKHIYKSCVIGNLSEFQSDRIFDIDCKGSSLMAYGGGHGGGSCNIIFDPKNGRLRKLTPVECERLQTVPDNYTSCVPKTHRYRMLGNGWTVDVIAGIFKGIEFEGKLKNSIDEFLEKSA